tara:strand:+ start:467 stop:1585 length:1119 start_codon:yes stop_codon:yes gene_type:complete
MDWLKEIKPKLKDFFDYMQEDDYSFCKYSYSGDLFDKNTGYGLANLVYLTKSLYISGVLDDLTEDQKENLKSSILKYSRDNSMIHDEVLFPAPTLKNTLTQCLHAKGKKEKIKSFIRLITKGVDNTNYNAICQAETRQSFAALYLLNSKPKYAYEYIPKTKEELERYLNSLNWSNPWNSYAQFSGLLFFYRMNSELFKDNYNDLIDYAILKADSIQSEEDGCWYKGCNISLKQKINGAMKYFTAIHAAGIYKFNHVEKLVDTVLSGSNSLHACDNFNIVYCLYAAYKVKPEYRKEEVREFLLNRLTIYKNFYDEKLGAFSFRENGANDTLYGVEVSKGLQEPDIHGTSLFVWGLAIMDEMLDLNLGFKVPVN